jgi:membrane-bound metal-dependent hydrolase YbcI (DUF457 family)
MDAMSHALVGVAIATTERYGIQEGALVVFFSVLPDILQIPLYLKVGKDSGRTFWIPKDSDWQGFRDTYPGWSSVFDIPHSLFFLIPLYLAIAWLHLPLILLFAYFVHIVLDLFAHQGEWKVKLFYPINASIDGITSAWSWSYGRMIVSWAVLVVLICFLRIF